jgi:hypothetical protein
MKFFNDENSEGLIYNIDNSWSDDHGVFLKGWIISKDGPLQNIEITIGNVSTPITNWYDRPDVIKFHPRYYKQIKCGFSVYVPRQAEHAMTINATIGDKTISHSKVFNGNKSEMTEEYEHAGNLFNEFIKLVNDNNLRVLEIGSRIVSPGSVSKRPLFINAKSYTGFDIYSDSNTDVVGDAHKLSQYFDNQRFDAVFSLSVFEHLAMPWVVAKEINKVLEIGGITYHATHFAWPMHERPWDFYRYSDEGLKALFSQSMGFKVIRSGLFNPLRMHLDTIPLGQEELALQTGFAGSAILVKKTQEIDDERFKWDTTIEEVLGNKSHYPKR